jgi:hypothetical protein
MRNPLKQEWQIATPFAQLLAPRFFRRRRKSTVFGYNNLHEAGL